MAMANPFVHVELTTRELEKSKEFYGKLFDWRFETVPAGPDSTYTLIKVGEGTGALGATIHRENLEVPGMGWLTIFTDPQRAMLALWQAKMRN
jgi:uncharacterized protein